VFRKKLLLGLLFLGACASESSPLDDRGLQGGEDGGVVGPKDGGIDGPRDAGGEGGLTESEKARVRFKRQNVLATDLARALELPVEQICSEVGRFDCFAVHRIPLGGVEPYVLGINEPVEDTTVTSPLAVERIALSGCRTRVDRDLGGEGVIFKDLPLDASGAITDLESAGVRDSLDRLYRRFLLRSPSEAELASLKSLYREATSLGEARPGRAFAIASCFVVATSVEALFY
jgi:hypothetical protein